MSPGQVFPDQKCANSEKRKIQQEGIVPAQGIRDPPHGNGVGGFENGKFRVKTGYGKDAGVSGEHQADKDDGANQKRSTAKAHDDPRDKQERKAVGTQKASDGPCSVERNAEE